MAKKKAKRKVENEYDRSLIEGEVSPEEYASWWGSDHNGDKGRNLGDGAMFYNFASEGHDHLFLLRFMFAIERTIEKTKKRTKAVYGTEAASPKAIAKDVAELGELHRIVCKRISEIEMDADAAFAAFMQNPPQFFQVYRSHNSGAASMDPQTLSNQRDKMRSGDVGDCRYAFHWLPDLNSFKLLRSHPVGKPVQSLQEAVDLINRELQTDGDPNKVTRIYTVMETEDVTYEHENVEDELEQEEQEELLRRLLMTKSPDSIDDRDFVTYLVEEDGVNGFHDFKENQDDLAMADHNKRVWAVQRTEQPGPPDEFQASSYVFIRGWHYRDAKHQLQALPDRQHVPTKPIKTRGTRGKVKSKKRG
jgi:hypothetical protein